VPSDNLPDTGSPAHGLVLQPFRALRPTVDGPDLAGRLCPPYDVIDAAQRKRLVGSDPHNAVAVVLPETDDGSDAYEHAAQLLDDWLSEHACAVDESAALYVYEMSDGDGTATRGLVGAVELRDPADGVILPHENTMAGPVADRLALMSATEANVEPIYLVYDGAGRASELVATVDRDEPLARTVTPDGIRHTLWAITDRAALDDIRADLANRRALIADGHHRYATYRELQQRLRSERGEGPWDFGLTLLVDSTNYGPQVHAIHRVLPGRSLAELIDRATAAGLNADDVENGEAGLEVAGARDGFAAVLTDGTRAVLISDPDGIMSARIRSDDEPAALAELDVTILHRGLVEQVWGLADTVDTVGYAHSVAEAVAAARESGGAAVLLRPTPVAAVAAVAAAGARMPRKSTLFTPKPASGLLMRRFADG
jgi:uncharacterized protein (DUF1015 family)